MPENQAEPKPFRLGDLSVFAKPRDEHPQHFIVDYDDKLRDDWLVNGWLLGRYMIPVALVSLLALLLKAALR